MARPLMIPALVAALAALPLSAGAEPTPAENSLWGIGATGIMCVRAPCPWRGIFAIDSPDPGDRQPLSPSAVISALPPLEASAADRARIESAWEDFRCVMVGGRFEDNLLIVAEVVGDC